MEKEGYDYHIRDYYNRNSQIHNNERKKNHLYSPSHYDRRIKHDNDNRNRQYVHHNNSNDNHNHHHHHHHHNHRNYNHNHRHSNYRSNHKRHDSDRILRTSSHNRSDDYTHNGRGKDSDYSIGINYHHKTYKKRRRDDSYEFHRESGYRRSSSRRRKRDDLRYHKKKRKDKEYESDVDSRNHIVVQLGADLDNTHRYKILREIGEGTFGKVLECWDRESKSRVAIKVVRAIERYKEAARTEIDILNDLMKHSTPGSEICIKLLDWFMKGDHVCMIFGLYGLSLYEFLKKNRYRPFPYEHVKQLGYQLLKAVAYMHDYTLIHTDLKPENLLFMSSEYITERSKSGRRVNKIVRDTRIKVIDFGSATYEHQHHTKIVSTRHYRAIEVILGLGWSYPCDLWSVGCIIAEFYLGDALFITHHNIEHLAMMERLLGPIPTEMTLSSKNTKKKIFSSKGDLLWPEKANPKKLKHGTADVDKIVPLTELISPEHSDLLNLLQSLLHYDPEERITAREALCHPVFDSVREKLVIKQQEE